MEYFNKVNISILKVLIAKSEIKLKDYPKLYAKITTAVSRFIDM